MRISAGGAGCNPGSKPAVAKASRIAAFFENTWTGTARDASLPLTAAGG